MLKNPFIKDTVAQLPSLVIAKPVIKHILYIYIYTHIIYSDMYNVYTLCTM